MLNSKRALLLLPGRNDEIVEGALVASIESNNLFARGLRALVERLDNLDDFMPLSQLGEQYRSALLDWFEILPKSLFISGFETVLDERKAKAYLLVPLGVRPFHVGYRRLLRSLRGLVSIVRVSVSKSRTQFSSIDTVREHEKLLESKEKELSHLVHLVNNASQDLSILAESLDEKDEQGVNELSRYLSSGVSDPRLVAEFKRFPKVFQPTLSSIDSILDEVQEGIAYHLKRRGIELVMNRDTWEAENLGVKFLGAQLSEALIRELLRNCITVHTKKITLSASYALERISIRANYDCGAVLDVDQIELMRAACARANGSFVCSDDAQILWWELSLLARATQELNSTGRL